MYLELMLLMIIAMPISVIYRDIKLKADPYKAIAKGTLFAGLGIMFIFLLASTSGQSIGEQVDKSIEAAVKMLVDNKQAMEALGMAEMSEAKAIASLTDMYSAFAALLPSVLVILGAIVSYIEYNLLVRISYRKIKDFKPLAYVRNFTLKSNDVMGWFIIYLAAYLLKFAGLGIAETAVLNINILVEAIIMLQGIAVVFVFCYSKRMIKLVPVLFIILTLCLPVGQTILFTLGIMDLLLNLRGKVN